MIKQNNAQQNKSSLIEVLLTIEKSSREIYTCFMEDQEVKC